MKELRLLFILAVGIVIGAVVQAFSHAKPRIIIEFDPSVLESGALSFACIAPPGVVTLRLSEELEPLGVRVLVDEPEGERK